MALKFDVSQFNKRSASLLNRRLKEIERLIDEALDQIARSSAGKVIDPEKAFRLEDFPVINRKVKRIIRDLGKELVSSIEDGDREQWLVSAEKNDSLVDSLIKGTSIPKETIEAWKQPNLDALQAFQQRKTDGMNLSRRVWNITDQIRLDLEMALDIGLGSGLSAADLSREVRKYLKYPDKLFRRVRDKNGNLRLSKNAAAFHPGRGVYRSSYKNALRLAATENNMAYRKADNVRWGQLDFVIGQRIGLSNNHPVADICDDLKGDYPKDFVFTGWHPFCRCHAESILASGKEFDEYQRRILEGEDVTGFRFSGRIAEPPVNFQEWVQDNREKIKNAKSLPYFIRDNRNIVNKVLNNKSALGGIIVNLQKQGVEYIPVGKLNKSLSEDEIAARIGGGDMTQGSCASLAFAWIANKTGLDVLDFRGGKSLEYFGNPYNLIEICEKVGGYVDYDATGMELMKRAEVNKQYYLVFGRHAAIAKRLSDGKCEYVELQHYNSNGWKNLNSDIFRKRFKGSERGFGLLIDIDLVGGDPGFRKMMGYINTLESKQRKGVFGSIK